MRFNLYDDEAKKNLCQETKGFPYAKFYNPKQFRGQLKHSTTTEFGLPTNYEYMPPQKKSDFIIYWF